MSNARTRRRPSPESRSSECRRHDRRPHRDPSCIRPGEGWIRPWGRRICCPAHLGLRRASPPPYREHRRPESSPPPPRRRLGTSRGFLGKPLWALAVARRGRRGGGALARCQRRRPERKGRGNIQNGLSH